MNKEQIVSYAKEAYQRNFRENRFQKQEKTDDVVLNKETLENEVKDMKEAEMNKLKTLDILRHQIVDKSKNSFQHIFHEKTNQKSVNQKMTSEDMYKKMKQDQEELLTSISLMKQHQINAHH